MNTHKFAPLKKPGESKLYRRNPDIYNPQMPVSFYAERLPLK